MSLGCLRLALCHAVWAANHPLRSTRSISVLLLPKSPGRPLTGYLGMALQQWSQLCTAVEGSKGTRTLKPQKKNTQVTISSVGRKIHYRFVELLGEDGSNLGTMHRADVLKMMDKSGLKLVPVKEHSDPPVYRLMSGKQIHEEQMKLRDKQKAKTASSTQLKELSLSSDVASYDLNIKLKQVETWLDKKHHIRLTIKATRKYKSETPLDTVLNQMVERICVPIGFVLKPKLTQEGRAATCVLRPPSAKELMAETKTQSLTTPSHTDPATENTKSAAQPDPAKDSKLQ